MYENIGSTGQTQGKVVPNVPNVLNSGVCSPKPVINVPNVPNV